MRRKLTRVLLFGAAFVFTSLFYTGRLWAQSGYTSTPIVPKSSLAQFEVFNHAVIPNPNGDGDNDRDDEIVWLSLQKTKGPSDLYLQNNVWQPMQPGQPVPTTGWHSHPGHSLIIVTEGAVTNYESDDPECKPHVYTKGMSFVDAGGSHSHVIRNEGSSEAATIAIQLIPAGAARKTPAAQPPNCPSNIQ